MANHYPVFLCLEKRLCVVVGGGQVAARKVEALLACGARVRVVSPELVGELHTLAAQGGIEHLDRLYKRDVLTGAFLVVGATGRTVVNRQVAEDCRQAGVLVNIVDEPRLCTFIVPAVVTRGTLSIAISTGGKAPALARRIREQLQMQFDESYAEFLVALGEARERVLREVADPQKRRIVLMALATDEHLDVLRNEGRAALDLLFERSINVSKKD